MEKIWWQRDWSVDDLDAMELRGSESTKFDGAGVCYSVLLELTLYTVKKQTLTDFYVLKAVYFIRTKTTRIGSGEVFASG